MSSYNSRSNARDSKKRSALGDISNAGGVKTRGAKKANKEAVLQRPSAPAQSTKTSRSSFGRALAHVNIDASDSSDPQACAKYVNEIYAHFRETEGKSYPSQHNFLSSLISTVFY